jgi:magnesium chelatase family protein
VTLAHRGLLFLDELAEFKRDALEGLRQPMEDGKVTISRVDGTVTFPCRFALAAAMNPCTCGYLGSDRCTCTPSAVRRYQKRISGPLLDRFDLHVEMSRLTLEERFEPAEDNVSPRLRAKVEEARERQLLRFEGTGIPFNAAIPGGHVVDFCLFSDSGFERFKDLVTSADLSTRSVDRLAKVAQTVADLARSDLVEGVHVDKAAFFVARSVYRKTMSGNCADWLA